jgi:hypothetical protein
MWKFSSWLGPNLSTTPIMEMGCRQCLPLSVVQLKCKHCWQIHCSNGVVDSFELAPLRPSAFSRAKEAQWRYSYRSWKFSLEKFLCHSVLYTLVMDMTAIRGVMKHCRIFRTFRSAEIQKSAREFSHGLNLKAKNVVIMNFNENCTNFSFHL